MVMFSIRYGSLWPSSEDGKPLVSHMEIDGSALQHTPSALTGKLILCRVFVSPAEFLFEAFLCD